MESKYKNLSKNTIVFTIGSFGSKFIAFFLVPLYTYVLNTAEYGTVDLLTTTVQLLIPILTLNIQDAVLRYSLDDSYNKEDVLKVSTRIICFSSTLLFLVLIILKSTNIIKFNNYYLFFLFFSYLLGSAQNTINRFLRADDKMKEIAIGGIINTLVACVLNIVLLLFVKLGINGFMIATIAGSSCANLYMMIRGKMLSALKKGAFKPLLFKNMIAYSSPLILNGIAWWVNNASDRYILAYFCGASINGIYAVAYKIPSVLSMLQSVFNSAWSVSAITEFDKDDTDGFIGNIFSLYTVASMGACSLIMLFNMPIAKIVYSKDFFVAWKYVPLLLFATVFNGLAIFISCIFTAVKKTKTISAMTATGAIFNTAINFALIPYIGATGAGIATLIGYFVVFLASIIKLKEIITMKVKWMPLISSLVLLLAQCIIATISTNMLWQIPFVLIICLLNRDILKKVIDMIINKLKNTLNKIKQ